MAKTKAKPVRKTKKPKKAALKPAKDVAASTDNEEDLLGEKVYLTELEMSKLDGGEARRALQTALIDKTRLQQEILTVRYREDMAALKSRSRSHEASIREITSEHNAVLESIEKRLGIKMSECTVADDGAVTHQEDIA